MKKFSSIIFLIVLGLGLQACSFRSTQLDLLMRALDDSSDEIPAEDLAWTLLWSGDTYTLYPVFSNDGTVANFVNTEGTIVIAFDSEFWQVLAVQGLLPDEQNIQISQNGSSWEFVDENGTVSTHRCEEFDSVLQAGNRIWTQDCTEASGADYMNEKRVNPDNEIVLMRFMVHPDYPMITLTPDRLSF